MKRKNARPHITRQYMLESDYEAYHYKDRQISNVRLHHHDFYELYYLISGDVRYYIEGEIYSLKPGDLVLINTTELHQAKIETDTEDYERIVLWIDRHYLQELSSDACDMTRCFEAKGKRHILKLDLDIQRDIRNILSKILDLDRYGGSGRKLLSNAYMMELMVKINDLAEERVQIFDEETKKSALIDEMIDFIEDNLDDDLTIDALAERFYMSKFHLSREFKRYTNTSIHKYIRLKRLILAKKHILKNEAITEVYLKCGFGDYSNFFRAFKQEYGLTPKEFYKRMQNAAAN